MRARVWGLLLCFLLLPVVSAYTTEEDTVTVAQILRNPSSYLAKEVVLQGKIIQIVEKEVVDEGTLWVALLSDGSTLGVAYILGFTKTGRVPIEGDRLQLRCTVLGVTTYETIAGSTNEAVLCTHGEYLGPIVFSD